MRQCRAMNCSMCRHGTRESTSAAAAAEATTIERKVSACQGSIGICSGLLSTQHSHTMRCKYIRSSPVAAAVVVVQLCQLCVMQSFGCTGSLSAAAAGTTCITLCSQCVDNSGVVGNRLLLACVCLVYCSSCIYVGVVYCA